MLCELLKIIDMKVEVYSEDDDCGTSELGFEYRMNYLVLIGRVIDEMEELKWFVQYIFVVYLGYSCDVNILVCC